MQYGFTVILFKKQKQIMHKTKFFEIKNRME